MGQGKVDIHGRSHALPGIDGAGQYQEQRKLEAVPVRFSLAADELPDISTALRDAKLRRDTLRGQGASLAERSEEIELRLDSIVSMVNDPEYVAVFNGVKTSAEELKTIQKELERRYTTHYRDAGARLGSWLAADSFDRSFSEDPRLIGIMSMKTKSRGVDAAESKRAAELAKNDPETQELESTQRKLHAGVVEALRKKDTLAWELQDGQDERWKLLQEGLQTERAMTTNQLESARAEKLTDQLQALEGLTGAGGRARIANPSDERDLPIHESENGQLNVLVWRDADEENVSGRWLQATGYRTLLGNVRTGAELQLSDGSTASWGSNLHSKAAHGKDTPVAVLEPAAGSTKLGREHGWGGLVTIIDSSG